MTLKGDKGSAAHGRDFLAGSSSVRLNCDLEATRRRPCCYPSLFAEIGKTLRLTECLKVGKRNGRRPLNVTNDST